MTTKIVLTVSIVFSFFYSHGDECKLFEGTFYFVEFRIANSTQHPIIMSALFNTDDLHSLTKRNVNEFVSSFFQNGIYVPDLFIGFDVAIQNCMKEVAANKYLESNKNLNLKIVSQLYGNAQKINFELGTGEIVFLKVTEVTGSFLLSQVTDLPHIPQSTNEIPLSEIKTIRQIGTPFQIKRISKLRKKSIRRFLHL